MNRKVLLFVALPLTLSCVCVGLLTGLSVRASNQRDTAGATSTAIAAQFLDPLKGICTGQATAVAGAGAYNPGAGVHPVVVFRTTNATNYSRDLRVGTGDWSPATLDATQLVACTDESWTTVETCPYKSQTTGNTSYLDRSQHQVKLRLVAAKTGQVVGTETLKGAEPRQCQEQETFASGTTRFSVTGEAVTPVAIQTWLKPHVAP